MSTKCIILLVMLTFITINISAVTVPIRCDFVCTESLTKRCIRLPENCTRNGGAIKRVGKCDCCDSCVYTVGAGEYCGYNSTSLAVQECGCNLQCEDKVCEPVKKKGRCHCGCKKND